MWGSDVLSSPSPGTKKTCHVLVRSGGTNYHMSSQPLGDGLTVMGPTSPDGGAAQRASEAFDELPAENEPATSQWCQ